MPFRIILSEDFKRESKYLSKRYKSLEDDVLELIYLLEEDPTFGISIGKGCFKIRLKISSKNTGKSGGARVITLVEIIEEQVTLVSIYDKSEKENISSKDLDGYLKRIKES